MVNSALDMISIKFSHSSDLAKPGRVREVSVWAVLSLLAGLCATLFASCRAAPPGPGDDLPEAGIVLPSQTAAPLPTPSLAPELGVRGEVVIWTSYDPLELESLQRVIELFIIENPDIDFALAYYSEDELLEAFKELGASGRGPTVLIGPAQWGPELDAMDEILDLNSLIDVELESDVFPAAWDQVRSEFSVMGLPLELKGVLLYRNRELAADAPATVRDWIDMQSVLASQDGVQSSLDFGFKFSGAFISTCGGRLDTNADQGQLWGPVGLCWLELLNDLAANSLVGFNHEQDYQEFVSAESPWLIDLAERRPELSAALGPSRLAVNQWPVYSKRSLPLRGYVWTENIYIASRTPSRDLEAAWAFARFLLTPEAQQIFADPSGASHIPVVASAELSDPLMVESSAMLRTGVPLPLELFDQQFISELENTIANVVVQGSQPIYALNLMQESLGLPVTLIPTATSSP